MGGVTMELRVFILLMRCAPIVDETYGSSPCRPCQRSGGI
jgi:hypothetical protein